MTVSVSVKGQMVIPAKIRKKYHIKPESKVELIDTGKEIVIIPLPSNPFRQSKGILKGVTTKDLIKARRKERSYEYRKKS